MSRAVAGYCPMGCGRTLILLPDTRVWCGARDCPQPGALATILADAETEHVGKINADGEFVALMHPLAERSQHGVLDCHLIESVVADVRNGHAPTDGGRYRVVYVGHDPVSSSLHAPMCVWEALP
ncbi:hypothetical protein SEA_FUNSIZED_60 [Mycobacterium phage Funsized]|nr:hypothetical protein SEA_FUNSIZED_60 [Mycobacterium phage Funsized]